MYLNTPSLGGAWGGLQRYYFQILKFTAVNRQPYKGTLLVPPLDAGSTWIDVQQVERLVVLHL